MKIVVAGGGSGGHVTPVLAVLEQLRKQHPNLSVYFICDRKFAAQARTIVERSSVPIHLRAIYAGKLRRYHGVPLWKQLLDIPTVLQNIRDVFLIGVGAIQTWLLLKRFKPLVVFTKGGFVSLPVGLAAHLRQIPIVIHDSDAHPGLTNRIVARWAAVIATGAPLENYHYPAAKSHYTGIPIASEFRAAPPAQVKKHRQDLMSDPARILVVVTGGGLGAKRLNTGMLANAVQLIDNHIEVIHIAGAAHGQALEEELKATYPEDVRTFYRIIPFVDNRLMAQLQQAADIVVSRGGATAMSELAALGKAIILVPNPLLTGGHQLKNARVFEKAHAAVVVDEEKLNKQPDLLAKSVIALAGDVKARQALQTQIAAFARPDAAARVAGLISEAADGKEPHEVTSVIQG